MLEADDDLRKLGAKLLPLAKSFDGYVHRRVTTHELDGAEFARVRESVDLTLAQDRLDLLTIDGVGTFVPFSWLKRGPLRGFDLRWGSTPVSMISGHQMLPITHGLIDAAAGFCSEPLDEALEALAVELDDVRAGEDERKARLRQFKATFGLEPDDSEHATAAQGQDQDEALRMWTRASWLLETLATSYLAVAVLAERPKGRTILKYGYDYPLEALSRPQVSAYELELPLPTALLAASHHVDVVLPADLRAPIAEIAQAPHLTPLLNADRVAFYNRLSELEDREPVLEMRLIAEPRAYSLPAAITAAVLLMLLLAGWMRDPAALKGAATAILFAGSGAVIALAQRVPDSPLARRLVAAPRAALVVAGVCVLAAGASVGLGSGRIAIHATWAVAILLCWLALATLVSIVVAGSRRATRDTLVPTDATLCGLAQGLLGGTLVLIIGLNPIVDAPRPGLWVAGAVLASVAGWIYNRKLLTGT